MEEKKIVFKSIDEQLAEDERKTAAAKRSSEKVEAKSSDRVVNKATTGSTGQKRGRKKLRLKKSARRTIGSLMLATSIVIGAIPVGSVSADSPTAGYGGNTSAAPELKDISVDNGPTVTTKTKCSVADPGGTAFGGFPLLTEADEGGTDKFTPHKFTFGGRDYYEVNTNGYNDVKPVYVLRQKSGDSYPKYLVKFIGQELGCYGPPSGYLNLVTGYINGVPADPDPEYWEAQDPSDSKYYLYKLSWIDVNDSTYGHLYGKKLEKFGQYGIYHTVKIVSEEGTVYKNSFPVLDGTVVPGEYFPKDEDIKSSDPKKEFWEWDHAKDMPITEDTVFTAKFRLKSTEKLPSDTSELEIPESPDSSEDGSILQEESTSGEGNNENGENSENNSLNNETNNTDTENTDSETNNTENTETENPDGTITVTVESEHADAGGFGLTGILAAKIDPSVLPSTVTHGPYDDTVLETHYVCDNISTPYNQVTNICDGAFKGISSILHIQMPDKVEYIGNEDFSGCDGLQDITLGTRLKRIGVSAFEGTSSLQKVYYKNAMDLDTIGAKAFADSKFSKLTIDPDEPVVEYHFNTGFTIPYSVKHIGNAAFYGVPMSSPEFPDTTGCELGDYTFAKCTSIGRVDLTPFVGSNDNLSNLTKQKGLFASCEALSEVIMTPSLDGMLLPGTFGDCQNMTYIKFDFTDNPTNKNKATFAPNEFDKSKITVEGPKPDSLDPTKSGVAAYNSALGGAETSTDKFPNDYSVDYQKGKDKNNDYVYRYYDNSVQYEVTNHIAYSHDANFPEFFDTPIDERTGGKFTYIFEIKEPNGVPGDSANNVITNKFIRTGTGTTDLEIANRFSRRSDGYGLIYAGAIGTDDMATGLFQGDNSVQYLKLTDLNRISKNSFKGSTVLKRLWAVVNGTSLNDEAFSSINTLERVTFAYGGESGSYVKSQCFAETPKLDFVDFIDDNLETGDKNKYARFFYDETDNAIASDAFKTNARSSEIVFKGPMLENFAPYRFAIDPVSKISGTKQVYPYYFTGNPQNLTCQYIVNGIKRVDPEDGKEKDCSGVFLLYYPNSTSYVGAAEEKVGGKFEYLKLREDSTTDPVTHEYMQIKNYDEYRKAHGDKSISDIKGAVIDYSRGTYDIPFEVPYGIDYLEKAVSYRCVDDPTDGTAKVDPYRVWQDDIDLYKYEDKNTYDIFKYNPDLKTIVFKNGGVKRFPDRMFEGAINLERVRFEGDVWELGELPFYLPDTEAEYKKNEVDNYIPDSFPHEGSGTRKEKENRSHVDTVLFNEAAEAAGGMSKGNMQYTSKHFDEGTYGFNGIIESRYPEKVGSKTVTIQQLNQVVPGRGYAVGGTTITEEELSGTTVYLEYAARDCDEILQVVFPDSTDANNKKIEIQHGCFMDCDKLNKVTMPESTFASVGDEAFGYINSNMTVKFPYNDVNLQEQPFAPAADDELSKPLVLFQIHRDAEDKYLGDYAKKYDPQITYEFIPDAITLYYKGSAESADPTYQYPVSASADGHTYGISYAPPEDEWPLSKKGNKPTDWTGQEVKSGAVVNWKSTPLSADTIFTPIYGESDYVKVYFYLDDEHTDLWKAVDIGKGTVFTKDKLPSVPEVPGKKFLGWKNDPTGNEIDNEWISTAWWYSDSSSSTSTSTSSSTSTTSTTSPSGSSSTSKSSSSSSSSKSSSSSSSSMAYPVYVNSQDAGGSGPISAAGINSTVYIDEGSGSGGTGSGSGSGSGKKGSGNATVISTTGGITDTGKISATVNGSSDNYVIKITQTQEADEMGLAALHNTYGDDISAIRYLPFDISLYDSTGTNKISPVPEGVSVSITMPIPDDLAIYGGNAKIASTAGGVLDKMTPRFTVINGVPCMTYTCTHFSPYMVWVDTNNLTEAGISDMTPKTADGIHPKWFLCFGLAAFAIVLFLKKDPEEYLKKAA